MGACPSDSTLQVDLAEVHLGPSPLPRPRKGVGKGPHGRERFFTLPPHGQVSSGRPSRASAPNEGVYSTIMVPCMVAQWPGYVQT